MEGFSLLRGSLDVDGYVGSKLNSLDFTSLAETSGTLLVDFHRINQEGGPISMERPCISSKEKPRRLI